MTKVVFITGGNVSSIGKGIINGADIVAEQAVLRELLKYGGKYVGPAVHIGKEKGVIGADMIALAKAVLHENGRCGQNAGKPEQFPCSGPGFNKSRSVGNIGYDIKHARGEAAPLQTGRQCLLFPGCQGGRGAYLNSNIAAALLYHAGVVKHFSRHAVL